MSGHHRGYHRWSEYDSRDLFKELEATRERLRLRDFSSKALSIKPLYHALEGLNKSILDVAIILTGDKDVFYAHQGHLGSAQLPPKEINFLPLKRGPWPPKVEREK